MYAICTGGHRHIDPVVDHERDAKRRDGLFDRLCLFDHGTCRRNLVAQLNERCPAAHALPCQIGEAATAGMLGINDSVETKIGSHHDALTRARSAARSSACSASIIPVAKLAGPCARCAASS